ncbi:MAG: aspartate kinase [Thermoplasmata archaeon]|nr:aspartate kinase [Thermoplasmata archaeon]
MSERAPVVVKFGGAALARPEAVLARLGELRRDGGRVVAVVSARAGVTDALLAATESRQDVPTRARTMAHLRRLHPGADLRLRERLADLQRELDHLGVGNPSSPAGRDRLLAFGERLAMDWFVPRARAAGIPSVGVDAAQLGLWTDGHFGAGRINLDRSRAPVRRGLGRWFARGELPVVTGYFGRDALGEPVTLGRGGSDYSASALGALLGASFIELVKRTASVRSADPTLVPAAEPIPRLSYEEAEELAESGSRVLHPLAVEPARLAGVELRIRSLDRPHEQTIIGPPSGPPAVRAVTVSPGVALWRLRFPGGRGRSGVIAGICGDLAKARISVVQAFTSAALVSVVVEASQVAEARAVLARLVSRQNAHLEGPESVSLVSVVGSGGIAALPKFPSRLLVGALGVSATRSSVTLAVPLGEGIRAARTLHRALIAAPIRANSRRPRGRRAFGPGPSPPVRPGDGFGPRSTPQGTA